MVKNDKKNIFLNKKFIKGWNLNQTAFFVQSPINPQAGIWWNKKWYKESKYEGYFATGIVFSQKYEEIIYDKKKGKQIINHVFGKELYDSFISMIEKNKIQYFQLFD